jgi:hypothetical protein
METLLSRKEEEKGTGDPKTSFSGQRLCINPLVTEGVVD